ncbi:MAG TPA: phosphatase PAP2 family protein [Candidatus Acidoferrum sp.]|nr:phosphatase PAP2 family protein [Candidatus Acidoferrum sp.]
MKQFVMTIPRNVIGCFKGWMIVCHLVAIALTVILVLSGFDWNWFVATHSPALRAWMWPAVGIGGLVPLVLPLYLLISGVIVKNARRKWTGWAIGQAELIGALIAATGKAFTGRAHPTMAHGIGPDYSHVFRFGWMRGGIFWGWPSSHTTIAFAMAVTVFMLFPKQRWLGCIAICYGLYVGIGVSMTIHWFSDFVAGAIVGSVIGAVVGKCFRETFNAQHSTPNTKVV